MERNTERSKLRKQPKRSRMQSSSAVNYPDLKVPKTAQKRRRKKQTENVRLGLSALKRFFINSRWLSLGLLLLTIYALAVIAQERRFYLTYIPVEGTKSITPDRIAEVSGLAGSHIFASDPAAAAEKIAGIPGVVSSTVTLRWPNEVLIQISEEAPVALWNEDGVDYGITAGGRLIPTGFPTTGLLKIILETGPIEAAYTIPAEQTIENPEPDVLDNIDQEPAENQVTTDESDNGTENIATPTPAAPQRNLDESVAQETAEETLPLSQTFVPKAVLLGALQLRELRPGIEELYYRPYGGLSYQDGRGWRGYFGTGTNMNQKLIIYETIVEDLLSRGIQPVQISVSNQEKPFYLAQ